MTDQHWQGDPPPARPAADEVAIDYIKAQEFRVIWADGVIGAITPSGMVHFALYAERPAIPRRQVYSIEKISGNTGRLGPEIAEKRVSRGSIVREMACDVFLSTSTAESLANWLLERVSEARQREKEPSK
ncbi:MAG: hypothetical protein ACREJ0_07120 [Geminicoccaceae bacterium]